MKPMRKHRSLKGYLLLITGFIACPCHLPITLALLSGTVLGSVIYKNQTLIFILATIYFIVALACGLKLLKGGRLL